MKCILPVWEIPFLFEGEEISKNECNMHCLEEQPPGSMAILEHILKSDPIRWLNEGACFFAAVLNRFYFLLFSYVYTSSLLSE